MEYGEKQVWNRGKRMEFIEKGGKRKDKGTKALLITAIAAELTALSETLATLPAEKRLEIIAKMLPYCLPRIEPAKYNFDESRGWGD